MPEPDFGQMARSTTGFLRDDPERLTALELNIIDLLRQVWNARGAADLGKIDAALTSMMGATASGPYVKNLERALKGLDH